VLPHPAATRPATAHAVLLESSAGSASKIGPFLELFGIDRLSIAIDALAASAVAPPVSSAGCLVLSGTDAIALVSAAKRTSRPASEMIRGAGASFFHSIDPGRGDLDAVAALVGNVAFSAAPSPVSGEIQVSADRRAECGPLAGLHLGTAVDAASWTLDVAASDASSGVEHVISVNGHGLLTRIQRPSGGPVWIAATTELLDLGTRIFVNPDFRPWFAQLVPSLVALRAIFRDACWLPEGAFANIIIDDPPLWPRYGRLDIEKLIAVVDRLRCACTLAVIPWNHRRSLRRIGDMFSRRAPYLGICYHGCDHTKAEFGVANAAAMAGLAATAHLRMQDHERRTGVRSPTVMVFPQGIFSLEALEALGATGYFAVANTEIQDHGQHAVLTIADALRPAVQSYRQVPFFVRRNPTDGPVNFAIDLFLGRPCLIVLHHGFFARGMGALEELAGTIGRLDPDLVWTELETIVRSVVLRRKGRSAMVTIFADEAVVRGDATVPTEVIKSVHRDHPPARVECNGAEVPFRIEGDTLRFSLPPGEKMSRIRISPAPKPAAPPFRYTLRSRIHITARRYATEIRDRYIARPNASIETVN
jgi:hypothetical protein